MGLRGWAARDKNGALHFHKDKPHRAYDCVWHNDWKWHPEPEIFHLRLPKQMDLPELKWEDEPIEVELIIRKHEETTIHRFVLWCRRHIYRR